MDQLIGAGKGADSLIKDTSTATFMADVVEASMEVPVIVDFWAEWCGPCKQLGPMLERAVTAAKGAVRMVKLDIDKNQEIAAQMRIQSIPAVYAFLDGRPVDGFVGAVPESQIKSFVQRLVDMNKKARPSPVDEALAIAKDAMAEGDLGTAESIYQQVVQREPDNAPALIGLARCALAADDIEDARTIAARVPAEARKSADFTSLQAAIDLAEQAAKSAGALGEWQSRLERDPNDHEARIEHAKALFALGRREDAVDELLRVVRTDREWNEQAGRRQLVQFFEAMGPTDPLTVSARKRLSSILFS